MNTSSVFPDTEIPDTIGSGAEAPQPTARNRMAPYIVFFITVFASMAAAAAVATEAPLMVVGLY